MAINIGDEGAQQPQQPVTADPQAMAQNAAPAEQGKQNSWSFSDAPVIGPIAYSQGSDSLVKLKDKMVEIFKEANSSEMLFQPIVLDNRQVSGIYYSSVVLTLRMKFGNTESVAFYTMLLASTRENPNSKTENVLGQTIEVKVTPGEAYDDVYVQKVVDTVQEAFPGRRYHNAGGTMVPAEFDAEDLSAVRRLVANASTAVYAEIMNANGAMPDLNLATARHDSSLHVTLNFGRATVLDNASAPMRSDIDVNFVIRNTKVKTGDSLNSQVSRGDQLGKVIGFIEPVWAPVAASQAGWGAFNPQMAMMATQKYAARLVITNMETNQIPTLSGYLLLLLSALPVGISNNWYYAFYQQERFLDKKAIDFTDVGALNIEANLPPAGQMMATEPYGKPIDTKSAEFTSEKYAAYMSRIFREGLFYSLDVPLCGPQTWYLEVFRAASEGNQGAVNAILRAADQLTNGNFSKQFNQGQNVGSIFVEGGNVVHLGYYEAADGSKRDIRDIDHLAVLNYSPTDPTIARRWSDSFLQTSRPIYLRLADRWNIIQAVTKNRAVLTGVATRVTFSQTFLNCLSNAAAAAGLNVITETPASALSNNIERGVAGFVGQALMSGTGANVFHQGGFPTASGAYTAFGTRQYTRWN